MSSASVVGRCDHVVVVGAGLGGLSAALTLAGTGRRVTVLERSDRPGGLCGTHTAGGYTFDTGPTVLTMPDILARPLAAVGVELNDVLDLRRLEPAYRARFADDSTLDVLTDPAAMADQIRAEVGPADAAGYLAYVEHVTELYRLQRDQFIAANLDSPFGLVSRDAARLVALGGFGRLERRLRRFVSDERLVRLFSFQSLYAGLAPQRALAVYAVISYMDSIAGVYYPMGGMHALPRAYADAAAAAGVTFRYGEPVTSVGVRDGRARSVTTATGEVIEADAVIVNADPASVRAALVPDHPGPSRRPVHYSPSAVVLHAGSRHAPADPVHHEIVFGRAWARTFTEIIDDGRPMSDPSFLVTTPTVTDDAPAPAGGHTQFALFPAPNLQHRRPLDWNRLAPAYRARCVQLLAEHGHPGFAAAEAELLVTPADWAAQGLPAGTPFSADHRLAQTGPFRAATIDPAIDNLLWCGAAVQPGVGVPTVVISGQLAARRIAGA